MFKMQNLHKKKCKDCLFQSYKNELELKKINKTDNNKRKPF